jgi:adenylate cyclase, class 2
MALVATVPSENEIKLKLPDAETGILLLRKAGFFVDQQRVFESNLVLDGANRHLRQQGAMLRVRTVGNSGLLTFKGPTRPGPHKNREELEVAVDEPGVAFAILKRLGFEVVFRYEKFRTGYRREGSQGHVLLDETPIGVYLELEGEPAWVDETARLLGFDPSDYIPASYGRLWLDHCARDGSQSSAMTFSASGISKPDPGHTGGAPGETSSPSL